MRKILKKWLESQWIDYSSEIPVYNFDARKRAYIIHTEMGGLRFRPDGPQEISKFRDKYINQIQALMTRKLSGEDISGALYDLYKEIRKNYRVSYSGNFRTRLKGVKKCISRQLTLKIL